MKTMAELEVYQAGELTVVGFGGRKTLEVSVVDYREELIELVQVHGCTTLALDLTGVRLMPRGLPGLLAAIHREGVEVLLFNASEDIREVLEIAELDRFVQLHEVAV